MKIKRSDFNRLINLITKYDGTVCIDKKILKEFGIEIIEEKKK